MHRDSLNAHIQYLYPLSKTNQFKYLPDYSFEYIRMMYNNTQYNDQDKENNIYIISIRDCDVFKKTMFKYYIIYVHKDIILSDKNDNFLNEVKY